MNDSKRKTASIKLGNLEKEFVARCKSENLTPSQLLRKALMLYLKNCKIENVPVSFSIENKHDYGERKKVVVTFSESEFHALEQLKKFALKPTYQAVIIAIFRAYISQEPYLNKQEILLLKDASNQLLAIGRNLNQITRAINSGEFKSDLNDEYLCKLTTACERYIKYFQSLINRATLRRKIKVQM